MLIHPRMGGRYREQVGRLREALSNESRREEAAEIIRGPVECIALNLAADSAGKKMLTIDLKGHLAGILALGSAAKKTKGANGAPALDQQVKLVAGAGFDLCLLARATGLTAGRPTEKLHFGRCMR